MTHFDATMGHRTRVLIVDDHVGIRHAIAAFVTAAEDLELAGEAASGEEAIRLCAGTLPDVVLMDISLPDMSGATAVWAIHQRWPGVPVIAMCTFQEEDLVPEALLAGATSYILKNISVEELTRTIRASQVIQKRLVNS